MIEAGRYIKWGCSATGKPRPRITWSRARGVLPIGSVVSTDGSLIIANVKKSDRGWYTCRAENVLGRVIASEQLMVFKALSFNLKPPKKISGKRGAAIKLPCAARSDLHPQIFWKHNGNPFLPPGVTVFVNDTLLIPFLSESREGTYTCRAQNQLSSLQVSSQVLMTGLPRSCSAIKNRGSVKTDNYVIDPDGQGGVAPFTVYCDMSDKNGIGVTVISHNSEGRTLVDGFINAGSYTRNIAYTGIDREQMSNLTAVSIHCEQFIKYECYESRLRRDDMGWWVSLNNRKMKYWGGASPVSGKCACGMSKSCADPKYPCNCDKNDAAWREDSGLLTDKSALPVTQLRFGDTGYSNNDRGYHTLGKLKCYGLP